MKTFIIILAGIFILHVQASNSGESDDLGYQGYKDDGSSVEETLSELKDNPEIQVRNSSGWTIATKEGGRIIWSFTPNSHPAHPSYVRREVLERDGSVYIDTKARCSASKNICDRLVQDFIDLNNKIMEKMNN